MMQGEGGANSNHVIAKKLSLSKARYLKTYMTQCVTVAADFSTLHELYDDHWLQSC